MFNLRTALFGVLTGLVVFGAMAPQAEARGRRDDDRRHRYSRHHRHHHHGYYSGYRHRYHRYHRGPVVYYRSYAPYYYDDYRPRYRHHRYYSRPGLSITFGGSRYRHWR